MISCATKIAGVERRNRRRDWRDIDFARMRVTMRKDDTLIVETDGGHAFIDRSCPWW
jgi:hypothetical protein